MYAELTIWVDHKAKSQHRLRPGKTFLLGRGPDAGIRIDDSAISRRHATFELRLDGLLHVTDLGSLNGTFLDGLRLEPRAPTPCLPGRTISVGRYDITLELIGFDNEEELSETSKRVLNLLELSPEEFEILGEIGRGAMGRVWSARKLADDKKVAIKVLRLEVGPDSEERQRFMREAELCKLIKSRYVVQVLEVRFARESPLLIMELVEGPSARERLEVTPFKIPEVLKLGEDVALALVAAAEAQVIHRDVKPSNILLSPDGVAKLGDFGIAKKMWGTSQLTGTGLGLGTLPYIAPEQAMDAKKADTRSDIYSLGATLYHLLAGRPPFLSTNENLLRMVELITQADPPPLRNFRPDCPRPVADLIHRMLQKDPAQRPQPASQVAAELSRLRQTCHFDSELSDTQGE